MLPLSNPSSFFDEKIMETKTLASSRILTKSDTDAILVNNTAGNFTLSLCPGLGSGFTIVQSGTGTVSIAAGPSTSISGPITTSSSRTQLRITETIPGTGIYTSVALSPQPISVDPIADKLDSFSDTRSHTTFTYLGNPKYGLDWTAVDNSAAIYSALNDTVANGGPGVLFIPVSPSNGLMISTEGLDLAAYRRLVIYGVNSGSFNNGDTITRGYSCLKLKDGAANHLFTLRSSATPTLKTDNVQIVGLNLYGNKANQGSNIFHGIYVEGEIGSSVTSKNSFENCFIHNFTGDAIHLDLNSGASKTSTLIRHNTLFDCRYGIMSKASDVWIENNDIGQMSANGIDCHNWTNHIHGNNIFDCQVGIYTWPGEAGATSITNNMVDRCRSQGMALGGRGITATGNCFHHNSRGGTVAGGATSAAGNYSYPHVAILSSGVTFQGNAFRRPAGSQTTGATQNWNLCSFDIYINSTDPSNGNLPIVAVVHGNYTDGRGSTALYGHIGISSGSGSRVISTAGAVERPMGTNVILNVLNSSSVTLPVRATIHENIYRTGPTTDFTDTTETAANIAATMNDCAVSGDGIGSFSFRYYNASTGTATLAAGAGITLTGAATIPANSWRDFVYTQTGSSTATIKTVGTSSSGGSTINGIADVPGLTEALQAKNSIEPGSVTASGTITVGGVYRNDGAADYSLTIPSGLGQITLIRGATNNLTAIPDAGVKITGIPSTTTNIPTIVLTETTTGYRADAFVDNANQNNYAVSVVTAGDIDSQFTDISGNGRNLLVDPLNLNAFAYPGYMYVDTGSISGLVIPAANLSWNPSKEWLIVSITGKWVIGPGSTLFSFGYAAATTGFAVVLSSSGYLSITPYVNGVSTASTSIGRVPMTDTTAVTLAGTFAITSGSKVLTYSTALPSGITLGSQLRGSGIPEGAFVTDISGSVVTISLAATATNASASLTGRTAPAPMTITVAFDAKTGSWYVYRNTVIANAYHENNLPGGANAFPDAVTGGLFRLGGNSGTASQTTATLYQALHIYKGTGRLPVTLGTIVKKIVNSPKSVVSPDFFIQPRNANLIGIIGQSNEMGPNGGASNFVATNSGDGLPWVDGLTDNLGGGYGYNSRWGGVAQAAGKRRVWNRILNTAQGSTSLVTSWNGCLRAYASSMMVLNGSYVLDAGHVYKAVGPSGSGPYTITTAPSLGVGSSGLTSWTDMGAARAQDTDGAVYASTDSLFDPNGFVLDLRNKLIARQALYDNLAVLISIGQSDTTTASTSAQYSQALQNLATYFTDLSIKVLLGMTSRSPGSDSWITNQLLPGRAAALTALSANPLVFAGPDIATALGLLGNETTAQPTAMLTSPLLLNNAGSYVHLNASAQALTVQPTDAAFNAAGL